MCTYMYIDRFCSYIRGLSTESTLVWGGDDVQARGGGLGSRPKKMYGERLGNGVQYHLMSPTPRR